ncbi:MAG: hypothetical protein KBC69_00620 [Candidatus Magasanikbacteria bacterium]|nr:hypothetical protein [Candidatus Magasanikbacteria bacterium]
MLTENDVVKILAIYLEKEGYKIIQKLTTLEKGFDIVAEKNRITLYIEAKGGTSSKKGSRRYEKPFTKNQVGTHVSVAIMASLKILSKGNKKFKKVAMAFPDNENHRAVIAPIAPLLKKIGIMIFLVNENLVTKI